MHNQEDWSVSENLPLYQEVCEYDMYQYLRDHSLGSEAGEGYAAVKWEKVFQNQSCLLLFFIAHVALVKTGIMVGLHSRIGRGTLVILLSHN